MNKILTHKFWILFGITMLVPLVGWWMASGTLADEVGKKQGEIDTAKGKVPNTAGFNANSKSVENAKKIIDFKAELVDQQIERLWNDQLSRMTWPAVMQKDMAAYKYRDDIKDEDRLRYRVQYPLEVERVRKILRPYDRLENTGLVNALKLPFVVVKDVWGVSPPPAAEMWDAQEDLWFTESIFEAIAEVNGSTPELIKDAPIRQIDMLLFRGGRRGDDGRVVTTAAGASSEGVGEQTETGGTAIQLNLFKGGAGGSLGGAGGSFATGDEGVGSSVGSRVNVAVDPVLVFGDDTPEATDGDSADSTGSESGFIGSRFGSQVQKGRRYIDDDETLPYKTRGFYLQVKMRNEYVPDLVVALNNMDWPTYVSHINMAALHPDPVEAVRDPNASGAGGTPNYDSGSTGVAAPTAILPTLQPRLTPSSPSSTEGGTRQDLLDAALKDRMLVDVVICGYMTIYREPELPADEDAEGTDGEDSEGDGTSTDGDDTDNPMDTDPMDADPEDGTDTKPADGETSDTDPVDSDPADATSKDSDETKDDPMAPADTDTDPDAKSSDPAAADGTNPDSDASKSSDESKSTD